MSEADNLYLILESRPDFPSRQPLFVNPKNKRHGHVKKLFTVILFAVSRSQTAEPCSTGGVTWPTLFRVLPTRNDAGMGRPAVTLRRSRAAPSGSCIR